MKSDSELTLESALSFEAWGLIVLYFGVLVCPGSSVDQSI